MDHDSATEHAPAGPPRRLVDYYRFLSVPRTAPNEMIVEAYLLKVEAGDARAAERAERALAVLSDPARRAAYDQQLAAREAEGPAAPAAPAARRTNARPAAPPARDAVTVRPAGNRAAVRTPPAQPARRRADRAAPAPAPMVINISGRWALALIPIAVILVGLFVLKGGTAGSGDSRNGTFNRAIIDQLAARAVTAAPGPDGVQTLDVVVNGDTMSYRPDVIKVKVGVPARFNLSVEGRDPG